jgi:hypothetical protein
MGQAAARKKAPKSKKIMGTVGPDVDPKSIPPILAEEFHGKANSKEALLAQIEEATSTIPFKYPVKIKIEHDTGVKDYLAVFWPWMRHITAELKKKWPDAYGDFDAKGQMVHDLYCHRFLGRTKTYKAGKTIIEGSLRTITKPPLSDGEMYNFLRNIEEHCISLGIFLPMERSEYTEAKKRQNR